MAKLGRHCAVLKDTCDGTVHYLHFPSVESFCPFLVGREGMESVKNRYLEAVSACQKCVSVSFCFCRQRGVTLPVIHTANTVGPNIVSVGCGIAVYVGLCSNFPGVLTAST